MIMRKNGLDFFGKFKNIFEIDGGIFIDDENSIEFNDYYDLIRYDFGIDGFYVKSRNYIKELVIKILFSESRSKSGIRLVNIILIKLRKVIYGRWEGVFG